MVYTIEEFAALDLSKVKTSRATCASCSQEITSDDSDERRMVGGKPVHEDCYDKDFSDAIEASGGIGHP